MNVCFVSLGCDKNLVDSEVMLGLLSARGYVLTDEEADADVIIVSTAISLSSIPAVLFTMQSRRVSIQFWNWLSIRKQEG